jgi:urate oxidase
MPIRLGENNYGKSRVRLLRVVRQEGRHDIKELTIAIRFEGDFETAHSKGENRKILPTDTMKNTVYVLARQYPVEAVEEFRKSLGPPSAREQAAPVHIHALGAGKADGRAGGHARTYPYPRRHRRSAGAEDQQVRLRRFSP